MAGDWMARLIEDERRRDAVRQRESEAVNRKAALVVKHGRRLIDELRATVIRDVETFRQEFPDDLARDIVCDSEAEGGFVIRKPGAPSVSLDVAPRWAAGAVTCHYQFKRENGLPPREDRLELVLAPDGEETARFKHHGSGELFVTLDALSEYLLTPVLTGRPR